MCLFPFYFPIKSDLASLSYYVILLIMGLLTSKISSFLATYLDNKVYKNLSVNLFKISIYQSKKLNGMDRANVLNLNEQVSESASIVVNSLFSRILPFILQLILIAVFTTYSISLIIGFILTISSLLQCSISVLSSKRLRKIQEMIIAKNADAYANASDVFHASKTLSSLKIYDVFVDVFIIKRQKYETEVDKYIRVRLLHDLLQVTVIAIILLTTFYFSGFDLTQIITINFIVLFVLQGFDSVGADIISLVDSITKFKSSEFSSYLLKGKNYNGYIPPVSTNSINQIEIMDYSNLGYELKQPITFKKGQLAVLTGESGSGKTTLLEVIAGARDNNCHIKVNNQDDDIIASFAYHDTDIFIEDLYFNISLELNLTDRSRIDDLINLLNLNYLKDVQCHPNTLSSGEKLRIGIARALYQQRDVYLFDEPTVNLDAENAEQVIAILSKLAQHSIVICSTHDYRLIECAKMNVVFQQEKIIANYFV